MMHEETGLEQVNLPYRYDVASPRSLRMQRSYISILKYTGVRAKRHPLNTLFCTQQQHSQRAACLVCLR